MSQIFDWIFGQYADTPAYLIVLEMVAVVFGFLSVWYAKRENILVFPTGIITTGIFVYILWVFGLLGDMLINAYYFSMSIYGWYPKTAIMVKTKYWREVKISPLNKYRGTEIISPMIQKVQFSSFFFAISHIPTKNMAVVRVST